MIPVRVCGRSWPWNDEERTIANLLPADRAESDFALLDGPRLARLRARLASATLPGSDWRDARIESDLADELEELESAVSTGVVEALLDGIASTRGERVSGSGPRAGPGPRGRFLLYRFGHSLETGEAEIASRGFFDARDRPPLLLWMEALSRAVPRGAGSFETAVLVLVPEDCLELAVAGRRACPNAALCWLDEVARGLAMQLDPLLGRAGSEAE